MRLRFFVTIFIVLTITAASVSAIHYHFFKLERLRLMELNLEQNAALLSNTDLDLTKKEFQSQGKELVNDVIGDDSVNLIIAIYSEKGNALYRNENAYTFDLPAHIDPEFESWEDVEKKDYFIKYLTIRDKDQEKIIKVGMILNQSLVRWKDLNQRIFLYVGIILIVIMVISFFLTYLLFRPVKRLGEMVNQMTEKLESKDFNELKSWFQKLNSKTRRNDEFNYLLKSLDRLAVKINDSQQMTQRWSALMAHELKTPMTRLRMTIDELVSIGKLRNEEVNSVEQELKKLENIIMDFLEWASLQNDSSRPEIHALNIAKKSEELARYLEKNFPTAVISIVNKSEDDFRVFCNPIHFDQLVTNIISNAVKYADGKIEVVCETGKLTFIDHGEGIPEKVLRNFGKPFNKFSQKGASGHGLGLAWINTIAGKYNWEIKIFNESGTRIEILFPATQD